MRLSTPILTLSLCIGASTLCADIIFYDDFGDSSTNSNLPGRTPVTGTGNNWVGFNGGDNFGWKVVDGAAEFGSATTSNAMAGVLIGASYFADNPGIYSLSAVFNMTDVDSTTWYGLGFAQAFSSSANTGLYQTGSTQGEPWLFMRNNGEFNVRYGALTNTDLYSQDGYDVTSFTAELILNTTVAQWTVDAYINGVQVDLDEAGAGLTYTYEENPLSIASVGLSSATGAQGAIQSITLQTVPEPEAYAMIFGFGVLAISLVWRKNQR
ncbi:hypothetical protein [Cerasicoccus frondis]|uniref:hypothetical protein n=1 Tax=Cerasicoccus frondis TaxID=490090 RepID=UPI00285249A6|nr:hypothetical protein [Cerasicoccus frondis]